MTRKVNKTEEQWKQALPDDVYHVCRQKGTEHPFSGKYYNNKETGEVVASSEDASVSGLPLPLNEYPEIQEVRLICFSSGDLEKYERVFQEVK